jgi:chemotaxis signal transduction protein
MRLRVITTGDDPLDEAQVQSTHHLSVVTSDHMKRTISQTDAIIVVLDLGKITTTAQRRDDVSV